MNLFAVIFCSIALLLTSAPLVLTDFRAWQQSGAVNQVVVEWEVNEIDADAVFVVRRKMIRESDFSVVGQINVDPGAGNRFQFVDHNLFKAGDAAEPVVYALSVILPGKVTMLLGQTEVQYSANAVRRTWGSIKAMFQ